MLPREENLTEPVCSFMCSYGKVAVEGLGVSLISGQMVETVRVSAVCSDPGAQKQC